MTELQHFDQGNLELRVDEAQRQIDVRLYQYDVPGVTADGLELIAQGALAGVDPSSVVVRMDHQDPPIGRVLSLEEREDGPYATLQVSKTARGDEALTLAADKTYKGASVGFTPRPPDSYRTINRQRTGVRKILDLREVSLTWRPAHPGAEILAIRTEGPEVMETPEQAAAAAEAPQLPEGQLQALVTRMEGIIAAQSSELEERARKLVSVPGVPQTPEQRLEIRQLMGKWVQVAMMSLAGDRVPDLELRELAEVVTADNLGVVPKNIRSEILGIIDPSRPFLENTRKVEAGDSGMTQTFPRITQRPATGVQAAEKDELASQKTIIGTVDFGVTTIGGAGDLSIQLLKRSSPAFLQLWLDLLAEQYAIDADDQGVDALLAAGVQAGTGAFDPETFLFGEAFTNASEVAPGLQLRPDRMFMSTAAFVTMIDARTPAGGGGTPMYPGLVSIEGVTANAGAGPLPIRVKPVLVPALDDELVDVILGPSRGFAWAEDGTYTLQADVPGKAGRDVGLVGMIWYMPVYPAAFTTYALA